LKEVSRKKLIQRESNMLESLAKEALDVLHSKGADYGDVRIEHIMTESLTVSGTRPEAVRQSESLGYGIRALLKGAWGFAASEVLTKTAVRETARKALRIAQASHKASSSHDRYVPSPGIKTRYCTPYECDPFSVPLEEKLTLLTRATEFLLKNKKIRIAKGFADSFKTRKIFASTNNSMIEQEIVTCGGGILAMAIENGEVQIRSYPASFRGNFATKGWEFVREMDLAGNADRVAAEAAALLKARECPTDDDATIILASDQLALQIHESIGHPTELDRVFGQEASFAGTSFLRPDMLGTFQYASPEVTIVADATAPFGLGTFGYDDEGTPAQRTTLIENGVLKNFLTSCASAPRLKRRLRSNGTARAEGWKNIPLIRMTNLNLEPGSWDFQDLISDTKKGILLATNKSWSIDDKRINFQFGTEAAWEIKNGRLGRLFKNPVYTGITPVFWNGCDAVCHASYWEFWGIPNCGKGEPCQTMHVGHGAPPARFRHVKIRSAK